MFEEDAELSSEAELDLFCNWYEAGDGASEGSEDSGVGSGSNPGIW